jgi:predicted DCC family thiol-disulfide oxidoreductase YuxK
MSYRAAEVSNQVIDHFYRPGCTLCHVIMEVLSTHDHSEGFRYQGPI